MTRLEQRHCTAAATLLDSTQQQDYLSQLPGWQVAGDGKSIQRRYRFQDYEQTLVFVNGVADIARIEDHHPDVGFGYNYCEVQYTTHSVGGLSVNDFICAAKIDNLPGND